MNNNYTHLIDMETTEGYKLKGLEANMDNKGNIYFVRDDNGVHAWHCNMVHKDDLNVVRIIELKTNNK